MHYLWTVIFRRMDAVEVFHSIAANSFDAVDSIIITSNLKIRDWNLHDVDSITRGFKIDAISLGK